MKCPTIWLKARTEEYCVKPSKQNSFDVCLSRRVSPWTMWVLKSSKFYSCLKTFPPEDLRSFMLKIKKILKPKAHLKCQMSKSTAFWTNFVHRMSPCSRFHTHTYIDFSIFSHVHSLKVHFFIKKQFSVKMQRSF